MFDILKLRAALVSRGYPQGPPQGREAPESKAAATHPSPLSCLPAHTKLKKNLTGFGPHQQCLRLSPVKLGGPYVVLGLNPR